MAEQKAATDVLIGGPYDRAKVGVSLPDVILVGPGRQRYEAITDADTGNRLGGYAHVGSAPDSTSSSPTHRR